MVLRLRETHWGSETIAGRFTMLGYPISAEVVYQFTNVESPKRKSWLLIAGKSRRGWRL